MTLGEHFLGVIENAMAGVDHRLKFGSFPASFNRGLLLLRRASDSTYIQEAKNDFSE